MKKIKEKSKTIRDFLIEAYVKSIIHGDYLAAESWRKQLKDRM